MVYLRLAALLTLGWLAAWPSAALAQNCNGQFTAGQICGNPGSALAPPRAATLTSLLDQNFGAQQGMVLYRGPSAWIETATPTLGVPGSLQGSLAFAGATAGAITLQGPASTANYTFTLPPNSGTNGYVLITNGAGVTSWANPSSGGTVTSVGLSAPPEFTVTISPITISGTLTFVKASQSENLCYCSPNGSSGVPTFRALVGADLPNPTLSSLGGVQAVNAVSHEWINAINTSGVPQLSQPAFTDISGTIAPAQLPTPTATTLGGVFSLVQTTSNWINSITTAGQPVASQPSFSDIAGNIASSQLPTVGNNTILSNISGVSGPATGNQLSPIFDSALGNTQGDIFYRSSSAWIVLAPGTMGQVLTTGGSAANISWTTVSGTGTVTSIATNNGVTGGTITASGTIGLASIATGNVLAFTGSVSGTPVATAPTTVLDVIGSTQGDILYRGASSWVVLAPGSNGQFLQTTGAGGTPQWATSPAATSVAILTTTVSSGTPGDVIGITSSGCSSTTPCMANVPLQIIPGGRLTTSSGVPIPTTDVTAATTLYYAPTLPASAGSVVPIYNGTNIQSVTFTSSVTDTVGLSLALGSNWAASTLYDVFVTLSSGSPVLCTVAWSSSGAGTSSRATALALYAGMQTNGATATCRTSNSATISVTTNQGTYLGTFLTNATGGQIDFKFGSLAAGGGAAVAGIWNLYNQTPASFLVSDSNASWNVSTINTYQPMDGSTTNSIALVAGIASNPINANLQTYIQVSSATGAETGIGLNATNAIWGRCTTSIVTSGTQSQSIGSQCAGYPVLGLNNLQAIQYAQSTTLDTFIGSSSPSFEGMRVIQWMW